MVKIDPELTDEQVKLIEEVHFEISRHVHAGFLKLRKGNFKGGQRSILHLQIIGDMFGELVFNFHDSYDIPLEILLDVFNKSWLRKKEDETDELANESKHSKSR